MRCPTCRNEVAGADARLRPFCSERCRLVDLARWLDGDYAIPGEPASDEDLEADLLAGAGDAAALPARARPRRS